MDDITGVSTSHALPPAPTLHAASQSQVDQLPVHHVEALPVHVPLPPSDDPVDATVGTHVLNGDPTAADPTAADASNPDDHNGVLDSVGDLMEEIIDDIHDAIADLVD
jgi:hypothetical protein